MQIIARLAFIFAFASAALAQTAPPQCAFGCLTSTNTFGCQITDNNCLCHNAQFIAAQAACIQNACTNPSDLQQADTFAEENCLTVGVTLTASSGAPAATSPSSSSPAPTHTNAAKSSSVTTPVALLVGIAAVAFTL